jgi:protein-tyrosine phosphatase
MACAAVLGALSAQSSRALEASVDRDPAGELRIRWSTAAPERVDVLVYEEINGRPTAARLVSQADADGQHQLAVGQSRPYVLLRSESGRTLRVAERLLPLEGGQNFRDLGGYPTEDGRRVRWGQLYRSGTMHALTDSDYAMLGQLGIRVSCDLRATDEREKEPTRWAVDKPPRRFERDYALDLGPLARELGDPAVTPDRARAVFAQFYAEVPMRFASQCREMFGELLRGSLPLSFNCSAGKDRTGVAAALLLTALGVSRETVIEDYLLSNRYYAPKPPPPGQDDATSRWIASLSPEVRGVLMGVERNYLESSFAAIERRYGSLDAYFERELGVDARARAMLRERLTEKT